GNSYFFKILTDFVIPYHYDHFLLQLTLTFLGINLLNNLFDYVRIYVTNRAAIKLDKSISTQYLEKLIQLPLVFFENRESGDIISRFNDTSYIRNLVNVAFISLILNSVILLGIGIVLYMINKMLFLIVLCLSLILISLTIIYYDILKKRNRNLMSARSYTQSFLIQFIKNMTSVYSLNKKEYFLNSFHKVFSKQLDSTRKETYSLTNSNGLKKLVQTTFSIIILFVGAKQIMSDSMTLGDFLFVNSLMMFFMSSLGGLIEIQGEIQKALVAKDRFLDIMNYPVLKETNEKKIASVEEIKMKNLSFHINDQCIIKDISVTLYKNEKIILVGESGSGKTTFSRLLNKLYPVSDSQIFINGMDINSVSSTELRNEIIYLNETPFLFKDSIRENLSMGEDFTEDEIIEACKIAQIYDVINSLSNQFNFVINESMSNLSTGQKQRLCLARAILQKPSVLILDESLSNVDLNTFKNIYDRLLELNVILIFITHNPEFLTEYDRKLVFVEKSIIEMEKRNEKMRLEVTR
ncbi:ABC transporter ATP-binding protein, partial [Bacillus thuringiensis]|uniref:peptidase domain-containing ABC transporter n=1 Tax=Bacillus thuringiensis TaxID=1428 RepID=UPI000BFB7649